MMDTPSVFRQDQSSNTAQDRRYNRTQQRENADTIRVVCQMHSF